MISRKILTLLLTMISIGNLGSAIANEKVKSENLKSHYNTDKLDEITVDADLEYLEKNYSEYDQNTQQRHHHLPRCGHSSSGSTGSTGPTGPTGASGTSILNGEGPPSPLLGQVGDFYIDTTNHNIFGPKTNVGFGLPTSLVGPKGATILRGNIPPPPFLGNIGDYYLDSSTGNFYGPKTNFGWGSTKFKYSWANRCYWSYRNNWSDGRR